MGEPAPSRPRSTSPSGASRDSVAHSDGRYHLGIEQFRDYIHHDLDKHAHTGINGRGEQAPFVCKEALKSYWTVFRIEDVQNYDAAEDDDSATDEGGSRDDAGSAPTADEDGAMDSEDAPANNVGVIQTSSLVVFSILCYIGCSAHFDSFNGALRINDKLLPMSHAHLDMLISPISGNDRLVGALKSFFDGQWMFTPMVFDATPSKKVLPVEQILPVVYRARAFSRCEESAVYPVSIHPCCVGSQFRSGTKPREVVFKMLASDEQTQTEWYNEISAYRNIVACARNKPGESLDLGLTGSSSPGASSFNHVIMCLGSFRRPKPDATKSPQQPPAPPGTEHELVSLDTVAKPFVLVFEHARGGTLSDFCERHMALVTSPTRADRLNVWYQLFNLLDGLAVLHNAKG
jgi:hypothetical protein